MSLKIEEALIVDYEDISKLHLQVHELHVMNRPDLYKKDCNNTLDFSYYKTLLENDMSKIFIVKDEQSRIIAYTILKVEETPDRPILVARRILYMNDICVDEQFQGKGIGKLLFEKAKDYAKEVGATILELGVLSFNENAIEFYKSMGMKTKSIRMELDIGR